MLSNPLDTHPGRVARYGWQELYGKPIQSLSTRHGEGYVDYSHGIRLVRDAMLLNGRVTSVSHVLSNTQRAVVPSDKGPAAGLARIIAENPRQLEVLPRRHVQAARLSQAVAR